jgi:2,3-diaminopropionate biosynthesis protein SbnB
VPDAPITFRYLSQEDVATCGGHDPERTLETVEEVLRLHALHDALVPPKNVLRWGGVESETTRGRINSMPGFIGGDFDVAGIKWISSFPSNPRERNLPRGIGLTIVNDPANGLPLGIVEGTLISAMRTGAVSGVAAKHLAAPGAKTAAIIGGGVIGYATGLALKAGLPGLDEIRIVDLDVERAGDCARAIEAKIETTCLAGTDARTAIDGADVVVTATTTRKPIVEAGWLAPHALYCQVGAHECTYEVIGEASRLLCDDWGEVQHRGTQTIARMHAAGELDGERVEGDLGDVVTGKLPGRRDEDGIIIVTAIGMGIEDLAIARTLLDEAARRGVGQELELWRAPFAI